MPVHWQGQKTYLILPIGARSFEMGEILTFSFQVRVN